MNGKNYMAACGLPEWMGELRVCECGFDASGGPVFHIDQLAVVLQTNDRPIGRGWHPGYVPFALCRTVEGAHDACERMKSKQRILRKVWDSLRRPVALK